MRGALAAALLGIVAGTAAAAEFRSIAENAVVMYDAPSRAATPLFVAGRFYPVEVIVSLEVQEVVKRLADGVDYVFWTFGGAVVACVDVAP